MGRDRGSSGCVPDGEDSSDNNARDVHVGVDGSSEFDAGIESSSLVDEGSTSDGASGESRDLVIVAVDDDGEDRRGVSFNSKR